MDHNPKHSKGFLTRINTTQEWEEIERKFQWQKCSSRKDASFILTWKSAHINESSDKYARRTMDHNPKTLQRLSHENQYNSGMRGDRAKVSMTKMFLSKRRIFYINLKISSHQRVVMWADFQVNIKDASFREEHFCHWNFRSISSHSWVVLILVRKPLECFGLWSMVLLAYLSDDSLMWADFQVYIKDASFREEHFCHWNLRSISSHSWVVLILVRKPLECFWIMIHGPSSVFIWRLVDVSWFSSLYKRCVFSRGTFLSLKLSLYLLSFLSCIDSREKAFGVFWIMIHGPSSVFIWRLVDVSWFSSLYKRCVFSRGTFLSLKLSLYLLSFLSCIDSREKAFGVFWIMIHGPSSVFIWRLVDVSWFSSLYKRCVFSRGTFLSLKLSLYLLSFLSCIDSREKAFGVFWIMIHGPSSVFIWRLVDVSWFSSLYKRCVFSRGTFLSLKLSLYLLSFLSCIDSREKAFGVFLIMIHGPSSLFIWRLVDVSWFSSLYKRCVFSRGTFLSLKLSLYLLSFLSCIDSREKAFGVFWIMIHGPSSLFIWRLVDVSWFSSLYKRCVFSRGTFLSLKPSLYLLSFLSCIDSREKAFGVFWIMIHGPSSVFIWRLVDVSWFSSLYKRCVFSRGTFLSLKLSLYLLSFLSCIDSREKAFGVFLIMIHGPSSLFIWRLVDVSWFSSLYKRCVFSRGTFLSLKLSLYLLSFLSCIDSREKAFGVFWIMIHGPSSLFIWRLVDVSWFSSLYKRCVFSRGTFLSLKLSLYLLSFLSCIDSREKAFGVFWIMIHGPSSLFIWRLVDVSWFSSLYKRCVFSRGTFLSLKLSLYLLSFLSCIDSREKAFGVFWIMIHGPSSVFIWRLVDVSWFSSLYKRCVFSRGTFLSLKLSLYLLSFLSCIDSREKAFGVFWIMIHGPSSVFIWRLVDVSWFSSLYKRCVFSRGTFLSLKLSLYLLSFLSCIDSREKAFGVFWIMIHGPSSVFIWRLVDVSWFSSLYKRCVFSRGTFLSLKLSLYLLSFLSCIDSREKAFGVFLDYDPWSF